MSISAKRNILLLGAGFTQNFGGPLADEMWAKIFNTVHVQHYKKIKHALQENFDFEYVYQKVLSSDDFTEREKLGLIDGIIDAYAEIDQIVKNFRPLNNSDPNAIDEYQIKRLLGKFAGNKQDKGFIFTLNQDLFIERYLSHDGLSEVPIRPGVRKGSDWFSQASIDSAIQPVLLPKEPQNAKKILQGSSFFYIKLHGSHDWARPFRGLGVPGMVIGHGKDEEIGADPLLSCYLDIFDSVLNEDKRRLLVIGYGFKDPHINSIIKEAVKYSGLELFVISPSSPRNFKAIIDKNVKIEPEILWHGLTGYINGTLQDIFPLSRGRTQLTSELEIIYFNGERF